jgi:hypothetical protein
MGGGKHKSHKSQPEQPISFSSGDICERGEERQEKEDRRGRIKEK